MQRRWIVGAALSTIPLGFSAAWLMTANAMHEGDRADFERRVRMVVQAKLEDGQRDLTVAEVLRDLEVVERERRQQERERQYDARR
jgi:hypothetical protein